MAIESLCKIEGCNKPARAGKHGWCHMHYQRWWVHGDPLKGIFKPAGICSIPGCGKPHLAKGWCQSHYTRWRRNGDPLGGGLPQGKARCFFEENVLRWDNDECLFWPYGRSKNGYVTLHVDGKNQYVHRLACEFFNGPAPSPKHEAAHSCGRGHLGCVNPRHLSWKTAAENQADKLVHGTHNRGERQGQSKLTVKDVRQIRTYKNRKPKNEVAAIYGISPSYVVSLQNRRGAWKWLD